MYKISPSKAHRILNCTASLRHDDVFVETPATVRGNILHTLGEMFLKEVDDDKITEFINEHGIDGYELDLIQGYIHAVLYETEKIGATEMQIEVKREIDIYGFKSNSIIDTLLLSKYEASIIDLKTGNYDVDIIDNEQLYLYGYGVLTRYPDIQIVHLSIFQKMKKKTITLTRGEIFDYFLDKEEVFTDIRNGNLKYNPSEKACKFCPIKDTCIARAKWIVGGKK